MSQPQPACLPVEADQANDIDVASFTGAAGYAVLDQAGRLHGQNPQLAVLVGSIIAGQSIPEALPNCTDSASLAALRQATTTPDAATMTLTGSDGQKLLVQIGELRANRRLMIVREPEQMSASMAESERDTLTGLGNRRLLSKILASLDADRASSLTTPTDTSDDASCAIAVLIDIDRFKQINDTLGHTVGDTLLKRVSQRLCRLTRETDRLIRTGGDEFLLLQTEAASLVQAEQCAQRIVDLIGRPFLIQGNQINVGASIGIAAFNAGTENGTTLLQNADLALHEAKQSGRNRICHFQLRMAEEAHKRRVLETELRRAVTLQQFRLVYQPQVELPSGRLVGFEALLRWEHPTLGSVSPMDFVPIAEETGEIQSIGDWVLHEACRQARLWPEDLTIAVNVSPLQFDDGKLPGNVRQALRRSGLSAERLEVEVTEGLLFHNPEAALTQLTELRKLGVDIAMDDFGTGYSSLSHLSRFPFTKVKIDQSFVRGDVDERTNALVDTIIRLGTSLGMKTLAEGVETAEQYHRLERCGCDAVQGYLLSRPMEAGSTAIYIEEFSRQRRHGGIRT